MQDKFAYLQKKHYLCSQNRSIRMTVTADWRSSLASLLSRFDREQVVAVVDSSLADQVSDLGCAQVVIDANEANKSLTTVQMIWDALFANTVTRKGVLIGIGGGIVTDLTGFAAGTYKRGIAYINVPTTLLAMIDASTGGKTGCNYHGIKNSIGLFYPPIETIICPQWLRSLPAQQFLSGWAEMLKTGLIDETGTLWRQLMGFDIEDYDPNDARLAELITDCLGVKERIVASDPTESGMRKVLNLGHTFGHALEEASLDKTQPMYHGYAVLYGLIAELYLSVTLLGCPTEPLQQLTQYMLHYYGRPQCNCSDRSRLVQLMYQDKKNEHADEINCTLLRGIGQPLINQRITAAQAEEAWEYLFSI